MLEEIDEVLVAYEVVWSGYLCPRHEVKFTKSDSVNVLELGLYLVGHFKGVYTQTLDLHDAIFRHLLPLAEVQAFCKVFLQLGLVIHVNELQCSDIFEPASDVGCVFGQLIEGLIVHLILEI